MSFPLFTSIKPPSNEGELSYLRDCLSSWRAAGFDPVALNGPSEIKKLHSLDLPVEFATLLTDGKPRIGAFFEAIRASRARQAGIINSDCRIIGYSSDIAANLASCLDQRLVLAWRLDEEAGRVTAMRYGYDAFFFDTAVLPEEDAGFQIGDTWWDLWFPYACQKAGAQIETLEIPLLLHRVHPLNWNIAQWRANSRRFWHILGYAREARDADIYKIAIEWPANFRKHCQTVAITTPDLETALRAGATAMFQATPFVERLHLILPPTLFAFLHWLGPRRRFMRLRYRLRLRARTKALLMRISS
jgi:hypothetical protein